MPDDDLAERDVVTCFLRNDAEVLLLRRSDAVGSYSGKWGAVAGHVEDGVDAAAREEIAEETGLDPDADVALIRCGGPFQVEDVDLGARWVVHPLLFDCETRAVTTNAETVAHAWASPTEILRRDTVPDLWTSYDRVRPTAATIATDRDHGAAYVSLRALEVLRDEAAVADEGADDWGALEAVARDLLDARPAMPVVENRVNRAMAVASDAGTPDALERAAIDGVERALTADADAAALAAERIDGTRVATLSRSGTVAAALDRATPAQVLVAESRPGREGVWTAERVAATGAPVTLTTDAAFPAELAREGVDALLVGADAVLADGSVVNKAGTRAAATVAAREGIDVYAVAASDKVTPRTATEREEGPPDEVYDGDADVAVASPTFDVTPPDRVDAVLTERGALDEGGVQDVAAEHAGSADW